MGQVQYDVQATITFCRLMLLLNPFITYFLFKILQSEPPMQALCERVQSHRC